MTTILEDKREIEVIWFKDGGEYKVNVSRTSHGKVTRIVAYPEPGDGGYIAYFAIYAGDILSIRINGRIVEGVAYK